MKTQKELIAHYSSQLEKVISDKGADSEHTSYVFYQLQAARMGKSVEEICLFANDELDRLKVITLDCL